jgi:hypothetical protein
VDKLSANTYRKLQAKHDCMQPGAVRLLASVHWDPVELTRIILPGLVDFRRGAELLDRKSIF